MCLVEPSMPWAWLRAHHQHLLSETWTATQFSHHPCTIEMGGGLPLSLGHQFRRTIAIVPSDAGGSPDRVGTGT